MVFCSHHPGQCLAEQPFEASIRIAPLKQHPDNVRSSKPTQCSAKGAGGIYKKSLNAALHTGDHTSNFKHSHIMLCTLQSSFRLVAVAAILVVLICFQVPSVHAGGRSSKAGPPVSSSSSGRFGSTASAQFPADFDVYQPQGPILDSHYRTLTNGLRNMGYGHATATAHRSLGATLGKLHPWSKLK